MGTIQEPPFYALRPKPVVVQTLGGLRTNASAQVLDRASQPIPGLFAVGQVTCSVHGADHIGGSALLELAEFDVVAGENAVRLGT